MEIYPYRVFRLYLCFFAAGWILSFFYFFLRLCFLPEEEKNKRIPLACAPILVPRLKTTAVPKSKKSLLLLGKIRDFWLDMFFCLGTAVSIVLLFYHLDDGQLRLGPNLVLLSSGIIYRFTLYKVIEPWLVYLCQLGKACVCYTLYYCLFPFVWCGRHGLRW